MKKQLATLTVLMLSVTAAYALGQRPPGDEKGVQEVLDAYSQAFSKGQALAAGPAFTVEAVYITDDGSRVEGREEITKRLREYLTSHKGDRMRMTSDSIRFVSPDIAEVDGAVEIRGPGGPPEITPYTALLVKREGRWMMQTLRDLSLTDGEASLTPADHVQDLAWMAGDWSHSTGTSSVQLKCKLDPSGSFLLWDYTVKMGNKDVMTVNQRVGWDPHGGSFRSWVFDSVGGFAEGRWDPDRDGAWEIQQVGVVPDGSRASATCRLIPSDENNFRFRMTDRRLNGARLADEEMRFKRVGEAPKQ